MEKKIQNLKNKISFYSKENISLIKNFLSKFPDTINDIYFQPEYNLLYQNNKKQSAFFCFNDQKRIFFYPFLLQNIDNNKNFFDITTPYGYGGPIANTNEKNFIIDAEECLNETLIKFNVIAELIKFHPLIQNHLLLQNIYRGKIIKVCKTISLNIEDYKEEFLLNKIYSYSNRKSINKAYRNGCEILVSKNSESWKNFIDLYELNLKRNKANKKYFFPASYYKMVRKLFDNKYYIFSCKFKNEVISSMLLLYNKYYAHCHLIGSNDLARKLSANNMLHHEVIKWSKINNLNVLHFGGGVTNDEDDAVLKFKRSFSNQTHDFFVGERIINVKKYNELCRNLVNKNLLNDNKLLKYRND